MGLYPDQGKVIKGDKISAEDVLKFRVDNAELFEQQPNLTIGTWYNDADKSSYINTILIRSF